MPVLKRVAAGIIDPGYTYKRRNFVLDRVTRLLQRSTWVGLTQTEDCPARLWPPFRPEFTKSTSRGEERENDIMKLAAHLKTATPPLIVTVALFWLGLLPRMHAVVPAPDGGYPGGNTAEGQAALLSLTTGGFNTAVGFLSLRSNVTGQLNTGTGAGSAPRQQRRQQYGHWRWGAFEQYHGRQKHSRWSIRPF